jgi:hypothetical protein
MRNRRADQAGEKAAIGWSDRADGRAHDLVIGRNARWRQWLVRDTPDPARR